MILNIVSGHTEKPVAGRRSHVIFKGVFSICRSDKTLIKKNIRKNFDGGDLTNIANV